jgi:Amt family ammonium transporter
MGIVTCQWVLFGYSLAFQPRAIGIGGGNWVALGDGLPNGGQGPESFLAPTFPLLAHSIFQCAFATITAALISGAIVGRMKLSAFMIFVLLWTTICYDVEVHWIWSQDGKYQCQYSYLKHLPYVD